MPRRILVTGATGTVGGATMRLLKPDADAGRIELLGAARSAESAERLTRHGFSPVTFDFDAPSTMRPALEGVDAVFLLTGYSVDMLVHSKRLLDAAKAEGVGHIVHLGALAADDTPFAHFAWHQLVERATEAMGFSWTHLRPNFFMDTVWNGFVQRPDRIVHFVGGRRVSWISSDDMAAVAAESLRNPAPHAGKTYPLAVEALTFAEVAAILSEVTERPVEYRPRPASDLFPIMQKMGAEPLYAASLAEGVAATERGEMPLADAVFDTVEKVTGRPGIGWREFALKRKAELAS
ncbi:NmrA family NAD(P)-binding protein [Mesorhizobium sp. IMUNJ 23232]|uniref:NmrA family NAD(P)-binding protein n=1 Tax=Mesorhizobium sp. IMUNJ 23232 TaxID=3376064 RepID=UPI00379AC69D